MATRSRSTARGTSSPSGDGGPANRRANGDRVYFIVNRHVNPTNICVNRCRFCAFSKGKDDPLAYTMTMDEILHRAEEAREQRATELHIVGGLHPDLPFDFYLTMLRSLRERFPPSMSRRSPRWRSIISTRSPGFRFPG